MGKSASEGEVRAIRASEKLYASSLVAQYATLDFGAGGEGGGGGFGGGVLPLLYSVQRGCPGSDSLKSARYISTYLNFFNRENLNYYEAHEKTHL